MLFLKTEVETWEAFSRNLMTAVTTLNIIDLPKITPMSLHSIVQAAQESPITRLTGKIKTRTKAHVLEWI